MKTKQITRFVASLVASIALILAVSPISANAQTNPFNNDDDHCMNSNGKTIAKEGRLLNKDCQRVFEPIKRMPNFGKPAVQYFGGSSNCHVTIFNQNSVVDYTQARVSLSNGRKVTLKNVESSANKKTTTEDMYPKGFNKNAIREIAVSTYEPKATNAGNINPNVVSVYAQVRCAQDTPETITNTVEVIREVPGPTVTVPVQVPGPTVTSIVYVEKPVYIKETVVVTETKYVTATPKVAG